MKKLTLIFLVMVGGLNVAFAQYDLTLYNMKSLQQSLYVNPAHQVDYRFFLGVPLLSSLNFNLNSRTINVRDINRALVENDNGGVSFNLRELTRNTGSSGFIGTDFGLDLIHFGFKIGKTRITFNATENFQTRIGIPQDLFAFAIEGNGAENLGREFNFAPSIDFRHFREYGVGLQRQFLNGKLSLGARPKFLVGFNNFETNRNKLSITTDPEDFTWTLRSNLGFRASSAFASLTDLDDINFNPLVARNAAFGSKSFGGGLDLGASYEITKKFNISASIINLGFIRWNDDPINIQTRNPDATFKFRGIDINQWIENDSFNSNVLTDSIVDYLTAFDTTRRSFTNTLFPNFYIGGNFNLTKNHSFGALMFGSFYNRMFNPALTLSYNGQLRNNLGVSISYSAIRGALVNMGAGVFLKLGPIQTYIVADNIIQSGGLDNFSFRIGTNFVFAKERRKK